MRDFDYIVCGNNMGAMAAALSLAGRHKVAAVNPSPNWGGVFAGIKIGESRFDAGMAFLEFSSSYPQCDDLASYNPAVYNDSARFLRQIRDFFSRRMDFVETGNLKTYLNGVFYGDIIAADRLEILSSFSGALKEKIISELEEAAARGRFPLHAANKKTRPDLFLAADYRGVSAANHGRTLHKLLFAPLCRKIFNISARETPALFHRAFWCPLYYPETLLAAIRGEKTGLPAAAFHYPKAGYFAKTAETLSAELLRHKNITILQKKPAGLKDSKFPVLHFDGGAISAKKIIWCGGLAQLCGLAAAETGRLCPKKSSIVMVFTETDENTAADFSTVFVCDPGECVYRATRQNAARGVNKFIFEMNAEVLEQNGIRKDGEIIAHVRNFAAKAGIFNGGQCTVRRFKDALTMPTGENYKKFCALQKTAKLLFNNVEYIGAAAGFACGSFNDQIAAALRLGKTYGAD